MKVGDVVRFKRHFGEEKVGIIYEVGSPVLIARILWTDGQLGAINIKFLEVISEGR